MNLRTTKLTTLVTNTQLRERKMQALVHYHHSKPDVTAEDLLMRVQTQEWPNLVYKDCEEKARFFLQGNCNTTVERLFAITTARIYPQRTMIKCATLIGTIKRKKMFVFFLHKWQRRKALYRSNSFCCKLPSLRACVLGALNIFTFLGGGNIWPFCAERRESLALRVPS